MREVGATCKDGSKHATPVNVFIKTLLLLLNVFHCRLGGRCPQCDSIPDGNLASYILYHLGIVAITNKVHLE